MKHALPFVCLFLAVASGEAQIQLDLKFKRLQYIAYEPVMATLGITNLAGRDIDLHDAEGQAWFGFEVTGSEGQPIASTATGSTQGPLRIEAGQKVTQRIDLASLYSVHDFGTYHVRAHIYFADLGKFFYSASRVFEVTDARPIWQQTVGIPDGVAAPGDARTYSLLSNRFPDHTSVTCACRTGTRESSTRLIRWAEALLSRNRRRKSIARINCMSCIVQLRGPGPIPALV